MGLRCVQDYLICDELRPVVAAYSFYSFFHSESCDPQAYARKPASPRSAGESAAKAEKRHCSQQSPQQCPLPALPSTLPGTFGDTGFLSPVAGGPDCKTSSDELWWRCPSLSVSVLISGDLHERVHVWLNGCNDCVQHMYERQQLLYVCLYCVCQVGHTYKANHSTPLAGAPPNSRITSMKKTWNQMSLAFSRPWDKNVRVVSDASFKVWVAKQTCPPPAESIMSVPVQRSAESVARPGELVKHCSNTPLHCVAN